MSTRGRGSGRRGRGRQGQGQPDLHDRQTVEEVPQTEFIPPVVDYEDGYPPSEYEEQFMIPDEQQSSHGQNNSDRRMRGATQGSHAPNDRDSRTFIEPFNDGFIPKLTSRRVMDILRKYMGPWPTWEQVPREKKEFLYEKFREHFRWLPEHEAGIRHSWEQIHKRNYKNTIYRFKKKAIKEVGGDDPMKFQRVVPKNMLSCDWEAICKGHMSAPNYQERCRKARQNRMIKKDGSITKHIGDSISFVEHARRLAQDRRVVSQVDVHDQTHRKVKGQGEYVDNKFKRVREEYERENSSQHGSNPTPESSFDAQKWVEINSDPCKCRVCGFGNTYHCRKLIAVDKSTETIPTIPQPNNVTQKQMQDVIAKAIDQGFSKQKDATTIREVEEKKKLAEEAQMREEVMKTMRAMMTALGTMMEKLSALQNASSSHANGGGDNREGEDGNNH